MWRRSLVLWLVIVAVLGGCSLDRKVKRLSETEYAHYYALRPFMDDEIRKTYLLKKTEEERSAYLKEVKLWDLFYKYEAHIRELIVAGKVQNGWTKDMVLMAWGAPFDKRRLTGRPAPRSELMIYRFELHEDGTALVWEPGSKTEYKAVSRFTRELYLDNDVVTEMKQLEGW